MPDWAKKKYTNLNNWNVLLKMYIWVLYEQKLKETGCAVCKTRTFGSNLCR
jgi:hypothetical protein